MVLILVTGASLCWIFIRGLPEHTIFIYLIVIGHMIISYWVDRSDVCPRCGRGISVLPSEGHFRLPRLSKEVRACPYCGADFAGDSPVKSREPDGQPTSSEIE